MDHPDADSRVGCARRTRVADYRSDESRCMTGETLVMAGGYRMDGALSGVEYWKE
jgi:hypothetical protein